MLTAPALSFGYCLQVYMGNLAYSIDEDAVIQAFEDCGEVLGIKWFEEKDTRKFLGAGVVEFDTPAGPARHCSPRRRSPFNSRNEGLNCTACHDVAGNFSQALLGGGGDAGGGAWQMLPATSSTRVLNPRLLS